MKTRRERIRITQRRRERRDSQRRERFDIEETKVGAQGSREEIL
ncbi:MAG TPA: hypothetical protein VK805_06545 [Candidatus Baltobacteraceae bacterium]|nr:hypothetical protein [Candidatus Baltobacteraceae bacterium]